MPCESCSVQFSVFKRKRICPECDRFYCTNCLRAGGLMCSACRILSTRPLGKQALQNLKARDLQFFLHRQNVSTRGCVEKEDLINLAVSHVNSNAYKRSAQNHNEFSNVFVSLKGFTSNINNLINSAFETRTNGNGATTVRARGCNVRSDNYSNKQTSKSRSSVPRPSTQNNVASPSTSSQPSTTTQILEHTDVQIPTDEDPIVDNVYSGHKDTADCLEVVDIEDAAEWEFVRKPAESLPNDSNLLIIDTDEILPPHINITRTASELDIRHAEEEITDTNSLKDEPVHKTIPPAKRVHLDDVETLSDLEHLNVKQLKQLLLLNRVDIKGCVERNELMERAQRLWKDNARSREDLNNMSMESLCKICLDAPLECVLLECGHIAACTACSKRLSECPICRQYVVRAVRFFKS